MNRFYYLIGYHLFILPYYLYYKYTFTFIIVNKQKENQSVNQLNDGNGKLFLLHRITNVHSTSLFTCIYVYMIFLNIIQL